MKIASPFVLVSLLSYPKSVVGLDESDLTTPSSPLSRSLVGLAGIFFVVLSPPFHASKANHSFRFFATSRIKTFEKVGSKLVGSSVDCIEEVGDGGDT